MKDPPRRGIAIAFVIFLVANWLLHFLFYSNSQIIPDHQIHLGLLQSFVAIVTTWLTFRRPSSDHPRSFLDQPLVSPELPALAEQSRKSSVITWAKPAWWKRRNGNSPPRKTADLDQAVELSFQLLGGVVDVAEVRAIATGLHNGPWPYSTHDLAVATALNLYRSANGARHAKLMNAQIAARMVVLGWVKEKKVATLLAISFEDSLYERYKPQTDHSNKASEQNAEIFRAKVANDLRARPDIACEMTTMN
jgi:hypothetical protein